MTVTWDYTTLAKGYLKRPAYAKAAIDSILQNLPKQSMICDIGAGDGHLTLELAQRGFKVIAVEPNDAMRANGINNTKPFPATHWVKGTAEETKQPNHTFDMVTFGSSFNVCDQMKALAEVKRIGKPNCYFACLWNHRDLDDPIQKAIEDIIKKHIPNYDYGNRRADQSEFLKSSGFLKSVDFVAGNVTHQQSIEECIEAWRSHGTLFRQAENKDKFEKIIHDIADYLHGLKKESITIPYTTRAWMGQLI